MRSVNVCSSPTCWSVRDLTPRHCARAGPPGSWPPTSWCASAAATRRPASSSRDSPTAWRGCSKEYAAKPYEELIQLIRTGPPRLSPFALKQLDEASNTVEFYVHSEDVRRAAPDWTPRTIDPVFADALWARLERIARITARRSPVGLVLRCPDGRTTVARKGAPVVTVTGEPAELTIFAFGRQTAAEVEVEGDENAVAKLYGAKLGM